MSRSQRRGWSALVLSLVLLLVLALLPAPYVIEQPGPVFDTLGTSKHDGEDRPLISIDGEKTYPTGGRLDMLTVSILGTPEQRPSWFQIVEAWFDPSRAVIPIDEVFAPQQTAEQRDAENQSLMSSSQQDAIAAALLHQGIDVQASLSVASVVADGPAAEQLKQDDVIVSANGTHPKTLAELRTLIADNGTAKAMELTIRRSGQERTVRVQPVDGPADNPAPAIGIGVASSYDFPFTVDIQLDDVGGPSAGMMFALGIIDKLTPGELNGGKHIAGTGTISADGKVGAIGGIRQKMYGALDAGAEFFLAPEANCDAVVGHVPDGLDVYSVSTLDEAEHTVESIAADRGLDSLKRCTAG